VQPDPPVRKDLRCAECGGERKHAVWNKYSHDAAIQDPFCSSSCCRAWHGQPDLDAAARVRKGATPHKGTAPHGGAPHGTARGYELCACELCVAAVRDTA
jgi:ribosomal protein S14